MLLREQSLFLIARKLGVARRFWGRSHGFQANGVGTVVANRGQKLTISILLSLISGVR